MITWKRNRTQSKTQVRFCSTYCYSLFRYIVRTSDGSNTILMTIKRTRISFFEHRTNSNVFIYWWSNLNTLFLASNEQKSNIEPNRAFTRFTKLLIKLSRKSNVLEHLCLLVIELERPIFSFKQLNIELRTWFDPSLVRTLVLWKSK